MTPEAQQAAEQLARDLGVDVSEAVLRACNGALMLRWLTLSFGGPLTRNEEELYGAS